eukprot:7128058-Prymnesium_polylepis.2
MRPRPAASIQVDVDGALGDGEAVQQRLVVVERTELRAQHRVLDVAAARSARILEARALDVLLPLGRARRRLLCLRRLHTLVILVHRGRELLHAVGERREVGHEGLPARRLRPRRAPDKVGESVRVRVQPVGREALVGLLLVVAQLGEPLIVEGLRARDRAAE